MGAAWPILQKHPKAQPKPQPQQYDPTTFKAPPTRSGPTSTTVAAPSVPGGSGTGKTSVDTPSMDLFANNIEQLAGPVKQAYDQLMGLKAVLPGAFYDAYQLRSAVAGANGDQGLQNTYLQVLRDLGQGLTDIASGIRSLSKTYSNIEADNKMTVTDLGNAMDSAQGDFTKLNSIQ